MSNGFTKLFGSILYSTVWSESNETRILWITMLAMTDRLGVVSASIPGLAGAARITIDQTESGLKCFLSPDKYSRTKDFDGRRIEEVDGGWRILNYQKYRELLSKDERKEYFRQNKAKNRDLSTNVHTCPQMSTMSTQADADADAIVSDESTHPHPSQTAVTGNSLFPIDQSDKQKNEAPEFVAAWNALGRPFTRIEIWSKKRNTQFLSRMRDRKFDWRKLLEIISQSKFCQGQNERGWIADVDFFLRPGTYIKAMEGKYDERVSSFREKHSGCGAITTDGKRKQLEERFGKAQKSLRTLENSPQGSPNEDAGQPHGDNSSGIEQNPARTIPGTEIPY